MHFVYIEHTNWIWSDSTELNLHIHYENIVRPLKSIPLKSKRASMSNPLQSLLIKTLKEELEKTKKKKKIVNFFHILRYPGSGI